MVGALSIVRFRTAIKEPSDIAFLFWSISADIILAAGLIPLAVFGSILIGAVLVIFSGYKSYEQPYSLVLHCEDAESVRGQLDGRIPATIKGQMEDRSQFVDASSVWLPDMGKVDDLKDDGYEWKLDD